MRWFWSHRRLSFAPVVFLVKIAGVLSLAAAAGWFAWQADRRPHRWLNSSILTFAGLLLFALYILRTQRYWTRPVQLLIHTLEQIRSGQAPIDDLKSVGGGLSPLIPLLRQLLYELREKEQAIRQLDCEMSLRVAQRTMALERQIGSLRHQATRDVLTGLFNRRMLDACLPGLARQCIDQKIDLSLLLIDVDDFKLLNDTLGHQAGDELLRDLGQLIRSGIRQQDCAFRVGGDEFIIAMPGSGPDAAQSFARRLCDLIDELTRPLRLTRKPRLSVGWVCLSQLGGKPTVRELIEIADRRLYQMKSARRSSDRTVLRTC